MMTPSYGAFTKAYEAIEMLTILPVNPAARDYRRTLENRRRLRSGFDDAGAAGKTRAVNTFTAPLRAKTTMEDLLVLGHANNNESKTVHQKTPYNDPYFNRSIDQDGQYEFEFMPRNDANSSGVNTSV